MQLSGQSITGLTVCNCLVSQQLFEEAMVCAVSALVLNEEENSFPEKPTIVKVA